MKTHNIILFLLLIATSSANTCAQQPSEFDEQVVRSIQEANTRSPEFDSLVQGYSTESDPDSKAEKFEALLIYFAEDFLSQPPGDWRLIDFPETELLSIEDIRKQPSKIASYTKIAAANESEAVQLRGAGALLLTASSEGAEWGECLILDIAQRPDSSLKWLAYWFMRDFGQDSNGITWSIDWASWQSTFDQSNDLGKAIILRNITMAAIRSGEIETARNVNFEALAGTNRALKAIALAYGDPSFGSEVITKWIEIANDASDPQLQALANEVVIQHGVDQ